MLSQNNLKSHKMMMWKGNSCDWESLAWPRTSSEMEIEGTWGKERRAVPDQGVMKCNRAVMKWLLIIFTPFLSLPLDCSHLRAEIIELAGETQSSLF